MVACYPWSLILIGKHQPPQSGRPSFGDAVASIGTISQAPVGTLRINGPRPALEFWLVPPVMDFLSAYPGMRVKLVAEAFIHVQTARHRPSP
jgi:hypothetical protein